MLIPRIITAIILIALTFAGIFYLSPLGFSLIAALLIMLAAWEYTAFFWQAKLIERCAFLLLLLLIGSFTQMFPAKPILLLSGIWWVVALFLLFFYSQKSQLLLNANFWPWLMGICIFIPCYTGLVELRSSYGIGYLIYILLIVWAADVGAYFVGKYYGNKLLAPIISPKKTIAGVYGGVAAALIVAVIGGWWLQLTLIKWLYLIPLVGITVLWSIVGDLFESMLKRQAKIKDSGQWLPGHGGIYDRIDSLTAAIPIFTLGLILLGL